MELQEKFTNEDGVFRVYNAPHPRLVNPDCYSRQSIESTFNNQKEYESLLRQWSQIHYRCDSPIGKCFKQIFDKGMGEDYVKITDLKYIPEVYPAELYHMYSTRIVFKNDPEAIWTTDVEMFHRHRIFPNYYPSAWNKEITPEEFDEALKRAIDIFDKHKLTQDGK